MLLALIVLPWGVKRFPYKRQWSGLLAGLLLTYLLVLTPQVITIGSWFLEQPLPPDNGGSADVIVILGRGPDLRQERVNVAAQLWKVHRAPLLFASGKGDAQEIAQLLEQQGIPKAVIDGESCSRTTEENARFTAKRLQSRQIKRVILVTDPPHMLRSLLTFRSLGFAIIPHPNPIPRTLSNEKKGLLVFREYFGLIGYHLKGRFSARAAFSS